MLENVSILDLVLSGVKGKWGTGQENLTHSPCKVDDSIKPYISFNTTSSVHNHSG